MRFYIYVFVLVICTVFQSQVNAVVNSISGNYTVTPAISTVLGWVNINVAFEACPENVPSLGIQITSRDGLTSKDIADKALALLKKDRYWNSILDLYNSDKVNMYVSGVPMESITTATLNDPIILTFLLDKIDTSN